MNGTTNRRIILDRVIAEDHWLHLADDNALPAGGDITVSLARWQDEKAGLQQYPDRVGLRLPNDQDVEDLFAENSQELSSIALIVIEFPIIDTNKRGYHPDGKAYTQAHVLRTRLNYRGEIRATGPGVMRDVLFYMARCGINAFELAEGKDINDALKAFSEMTVAYQPAADGMTAAFIRRRSQAA